jgi:hypothetical protein
VITDPGAAAAADQSPDPGAEQSRLAVSSGGLANQRPGSSSPGTPVQSSLLGLVHRLGTSAQQQESAHSYHGLFHQSHFLNNGLQIAPDHENRQEKNGQYMLFTIKDQP